MSKRLFAALFSISVIVAPVMSQTQPDVLSSLE